MSSADTEVQVLRRVVVLALLASIPFLASPAAQAADGTARYSYRVKDLDYKALATMQAAIQPGGFFNCNVGDAAFSGRVDGGAGDLAPLDGYGDGTIRIGRRGTSGSFDATSPARFSLTSAEHVEVTGCEGDPPYATSLATTKCTDEVQESVGVSAAVDSGVGNRVKLSWSVYASGGADPGSSSIPLFDCVAPLEFADVHCKSQKLDLSTFTEKAFTLSFRCGQSTEEIPGYGYTLYAGDTSISGKLKIKRVKRS